MKQNLTYKGFTGSIEPEEDGTLYGKVLNISALVMYDGVDMADLEKRFRESVDDHIDFCAEEGWDPVHAPAPALMPLKAAQG